MMRVVGPSIRGEGEYFALIPDTINPSQQHVTAISVYFVSLITTQAIRKLIWCCNGVAIKATGYIRTLDFFLIKANLFLLPCFEETLSNPA